MIATRALNMGKISFLVCFLFLQGSYCQCPWQADPTYGSLISSCQCNFGQETNAVTVLCHKTNFSSVLGALQAYGQNSVIELLHINDTRIESLADFSLKNIKLIDLRLHNCDIRDISSNAFRGLENTLQNLDLASNALSHIPVLPLRQLRLLSQLDLSGNGVRVVPANAFVTLRLKTLKMAHNNLTFADNALQGLEQSLKNLNLKGCGLRQIPTAIRDLRGLTFLDLAQNNIRTLEEGAFARMDSLTALNLERNIIQSLGAATFVGINDTLSSLSLLNNLITEYPTRAINSLRQLRVGQSLKSIFASTSNWTLNFFYRFWILASI